jgi:hypothetical protein
LPRIFEQYEKKAREILEANRSGSYTRPSPLLYPHQWNWDSGFIAIGKSHYDTRGAVSEIESLFSAQWSNGMLPQVVFNPDATGGYFPEPDFWETERSAHKPADKLTSGITMPPIHAVAVERIWANAPRDRRRVLEFLEWIYPRLLSFHEYLYRERDPEDTGLASIRHPWESGIDNSPAWDPPLKAINVDKNALPAYQRRDLDHVASDMRPKDDDYDRYVYLLDLFRSLDYDESAIREQCPFLVLDPLFNSILCRANQCLANLAGILGEPIGAIEHWQRKSAEAIRTKLWCPTRQMFYPYDQVAGRLIHSETSSGFMPLFAGAATREQASIIYRRLNSVSFCALHQGNCYATPNYDTQKEDFDRSNYWRGPVWININWMLAHGLTRYGYTLKADSLRRDLLQLPIRFGFHEYFDSFSGKGYGSDNFSWTAALFIDLVQDHYNAEKIPGPLSRTLKGLLSPAKVLNPGGKAPPLAPGQLSAELMKSIRAMRDEHYDTDRGLVNYDAIRDSEAFLQYRDLTIGLRTFDIETLASDDERLAFWINMYNTLVVDGIISLGIERSVLEHAGFFRRICYNINGGIFSLNDVEHGILRGNRRGPYSLLRPFRLWERQRRLSILVPDPRVHFALVCGSRSCAPIEFYDPERIHEQLDQAARSFANSTEVLVFPEENRLLLSEIFRWYREDFGGRDGVIEFILRHMTDSDSREYLADNRGRIILEYLFYDWDLNRWGK